MANNDELLLEEQERFLAYLDGTMPPDEAQAFLAQLQSDPEFHQRFRDYERTTNLLHGLGNEADLEPVDLLPNLERRMGMRRRTSPGLSWRLPIEVGGLLAVMLVAVLVFMNELRRSDQIVVPETKPGPVEVFVQSPPSAETSQAFRLSITEASRLEPPHVWMTRLSHSEIEGLLTSLGTAITRVRNFPDNPCEPCAVLVFEIAPPR